MKIGIIGFGNMGRAIAEQLKADYTVLVFDKDKNKTKDVFRIKVAKDPEDLLNRVDIVILAIKPQDFDSVLKEIKEHTKGKLIVSIAAGIDTKYIERNIGEVRVIRAMPNIGIKIKESETFLCKGEYARDGDLHFVEQLFQLMGKTWNIDETMINPSTAISGSGPAYIYYDIEKNKIDPLNIPEDIKQEYIQRLAKAAEAVGFDRQLAEEVAFNVSYTTIDLVKKTNMSVDELRKQISSKGGTTEAALEELRRGYSWSEAARAALRRAEELAKKE